MQSQNAEASPTTGKLHHPRFWKRFCRVIARLYWFVGGMANILGIYGFGESHHWWGFAFTISILPETKEVLWMLALGVGGPWAMMLASIAVARSVEIVTGDREATLVVVRSVVNVGSFFAILHCAQMTFDISIFPRYLSGEGFAKVVGAYVLLGLAVGALASMTVYAARRIALRGSG